MTYKSDSVCPVCASGRPLIAYAQGSPVSGAEEISDAELARAHFLSALVLLKCSPLTPSTVQAASVALRAGSEQLNVLRPDTLDDDALLELCQLEKRVRAVLSHATQVCL